MPLATTCGPVTAPVRLPSPACQRAGLNVEPVIPGLVTPLDVFLHAPSSSLRATLRTQFDELDVIGLST
jgi:hypothetical protein